MSSQSVGQLIATIPIAGQLYNTFTTAKSLLTSTPSESSAGLVVLPSNFFQRGAVVHIDFQLGLSNIATTPGTFTLQVMVGSVIAFTTGAVIMTTTANTLLPVTGNIQLSCSTQGAGTTATLRGQCSLQGVNVAMQSGANFAAGTGFAQAPATSPGVGTGFDSTIANTLDFFGAFSISNAGNGLQLQQYAVKSWGNTAV